MVTRTPGPFDYYGDRYGGVTGAQIRTAAAKPGAHASKITELASDLEGVEKKVVSSARGDVAQGVKKHPKAAKDSAHHLAANGQFACAILRLFADDVDKLDNSINTVNEKYKSAQFLTNHLPEFRNGDMSASDFLDQKKSQLKPDAEEAWETLHEDASDVSAKLKDGPDDLDTVRQLIREGLMPLSAASLFPGLKLTVADKQGALKSWMKGKSAKELEAYLADHPGLRGVTRHLLDKEHLSDQEKAIVQAQAKVDAKIIKDAVNNGEPSEETLKQIGAAERLLKHINDELADGGEITEARHAFMFTWMNGVGAAALAKLPSVVRDSVRKTGGGPPGYSAGPQYKQYVRPVGNAILNLSNGAKYAAHVGGAKGARPQDVPQITLEEMPEAIQDLARMRIGENENGYRVGDASGDGPGSFSHIKNLDRFNGWADLLAASSDDVEGGEKFSYAVADQAIEAKQDMNAILGSAGGLTHRAESTGDWGEYEGIGSPAALQDLKGKLLDTGASDLLGVASRNEDASSDILLDDDNRKALLGLNWDDDQGAADVIRAGTDRDPGGTAENPDNKGGGTPLQTRAALAVMQDVGDDVTGYMGGRYDSDGDGDIDSDDAEAPARMTEGVSDAVVDMGIEWVDQFGQEIGTGTEDEVNPDNTMTLSADTQDHFLRFIAAAGDDPSETPGINDAVRFRAAANLDAEHDLAQAMNGHGDLTSALERTGRLHGAMNDAEYQYGLDQAAGDDADETEKKQAAYEVEKHRWAAGKFAAKLAISGGGAALGGVPGALLSTAASGVVDQFGPGEPPDDVTENLHRFAANQLDGQQRDAPYEKRHLIVNAALMSGRLDPDQVNGSILATGESGENGKPQLKPYAEIQQDLGDLTDTYNRVSNKHDIDQTNEWWDSEYAGQNEPPPPGGAWTDGSSARDYLYGDRLPEDPPPGLYEERYTDDPSRFYRVDPSDR